MGTLKQLFSDSLRTPWERLSQKSARKGSDLGVPWGESVRRQKCEKRTTVLKFSGRPGPARVPIRGPCLGGPGDFRTPLAETCEIWGVPVGHHFLFRFGVVLGALGNPPSGSVRGHPETEALRKRVKNGVPGRVNLQTVLQFAHGGISVWRPIRSTRVPGGSRKVVVWGLKKVFQKVV